MAFAALLAAVLAMSSGGVAAGEAQPAPGPNALLLSDGRVLAPGAVSGFASAGRGTGRVSTADAQAGLSTSGPIGTAEPGEAGSAKNVIGTDNRIRVTNTRAYPFRAVGQITFRLGGNSFICSGWLISRNTVATAAHCIHGGPGKGFATNVRFFPGRNGANNPFGGCSGRLSVIPNGWATTGNEIYDYGAFKLNCSIGNTVGWFGFRATSGTGIVGKTALNTGYPGDKPSGTQWRSSNTFRAAQTQQLFYANDTAGGLSGSPVYQNTGCNGPCGLAIHAYGWGHNGFPHNTWNHGTRINSTVNQFLINVRNRA